MIIDRPPMGWNSWNTFGPKISETMIMETADALVSSGLWDVGYHYAIGIFNMDDQPHNIWFTMDDIGLNRSTGRSFKLKNLWTGEIEEMVNGLYKSVVEPHDCRLFRAKLIEE